ncbi:MAG: COX15/CtaA family protein [Solirubrobacterales bacterium]
MDERLTISAPAFRRWAYASLAALAAIVFTGAAVRLTGSGLGCPDWPKCFGQAVAPLETHAVIEYGNRLLSGLVVVVTVVTGVLAWRRRPFRRELAVLGTLLPIGVMMQAGLGALTVIFHLKPGFVMGHYILSMLLLDAAFATAWVATFEREDRPASSDKLGVWAVRALLPLGSLTIIAGTAATAAGPHAGGAGTGDEIARLEFMGASTLEWIVQRHGALAVALGLAVIGVLALLRRAGGERRAVRPLLVVLALIATQGVVGITQWLAELPPGIVWIHVVLAVGTWVALLNSAASAGWLEPEAARIHEHHADRGRSDLATGAAAT